MEVTFKEDYILVVSPFVTYLCGLFSFNGIPSRARGAAFFPFIILRSERENVPWVINHERIHLRQQRETLFIGSMLLNVIETAYACIVLRKTLPQAYLWRTTEQEAYRNQHDFSYLQKRKTWAQFRYYLRDKKEFTLGAPGEIILS